MENGRNYWQRAMRHRLSRRDLLRAGAVAGAGLAAGLPILGCGSGQTQQSSTAKGGQTPQTTQPKSGGILKIGYQKGFGTLNPGQSTQGFDPNYLLVIGDSLVYTAYDGSPDPVSSLATAWKQEDDTTYTFSLRQGIKFHDGTDYDAAAQKANFEYLLDDKRSKGFGFRGLIDPIKEMEVVDKYTLRVRLSRVFPAFIANLGAQPGIPVSPTALDKLGPDIATKPVLTGPFVVKSFVSGGDWVFEKNPNYWRKGLPYLDGITFTEIPDDRVRAASLQSGQVDVGYFNEVGDVTAKLKQDPSLIVSEAQTGPMILRVNQALPPLDNPKIRQALACCIDREAIVKSVFQGLLPVAKGGLIPLGNWGYVDVSDAQYKFDINRAKELIKESGVSGPIQLKMLANEFSANQLQGQLIKGWLEEAGFEVSFDIKAEAECARLILDEGVVHLMSTTAGTRVDPGGTLDMYSTSTSYYNPGRKSQEPVQKQIDDLVQKGGTVSDQKERKKAYDEAQRLQTQYVIGQIVLSYRLFTIAHRQNVKETENIWVPAMSSFRVRFLWKE